MSTTSSPEVRPRPVVPDLPPTLVPNPIATVAKAPSRMLSTVGSLLVYGLFTVGSVALARNAHTVVHSLRPTGRETVFDLRHDEPALVTPAPPVPNLSPVNVTGLTRPADWKPVDPSNAIPDDSPTTLPTHDGTFDHLYSKDMPAAKPGETPTGGEELLRRGVTRVPSSSTPQTVDVAYHQVKVLHQAPVTYPPLARLAKIQGLVEMLITIDVDGVPSAVQALSGPPQLHAEALRCAREWRFEPARLDGQPVSARFKLTIHFKLQ